MAMLAVNITAEDGTVTLDVWLQAYDEFAKQWFDVPYDLQMTSSSSAADVTANTNRRNINGTSAAAGVSKHIAIYKHLPAGKVRLNWDTSGTTSFIWSASLSGK